jgi:hypothetical protein
MRNGSLFLSYTFLLLASPARCQERGLAAWWRFDEGSGDRATDSAMHIEDSIHGNARFAPGVRGSGLKFDGFTAYVSRQAGLAPKLASAFSFGAWIALQEYPLNWVGIVDHEKSGASGYRFGLDARGRLGLQAAIGGTWRECVSPAPLSLLVWHHVAATWDPVTGMVLYVEGRAVAHLQTEGSFSPAADTELRIGKNLEMLPPTDLVRPKAAFPAI